jgi:GNAT superfamily N-acetyltransferase
VAATALKQASRFVRGVDREELALVVRAMLNSSHIVVACSEADEDTLLGWAAAIGGVSWFCFVSKDARRNGIGSRLRSEVVRGSIDPAREWGAHRRAHDGNDPRARLAGDVLSLWGADS